MKLVITSANIWKLFPTNYSTVMMRYNNNFRTEKVLRFISASTETIQGEVCGGIGYKMKTL